MYLCPRRMAMNAVLGAFGVFVGGRLDEAPAREERDPDSRFEAGVATDR